MAHYPIEEMMRWLIIAICIVFFFNVFAVGFNVIQINNFEQSVDNTIANTGKLNTSEINSQISPKFDNYFTVTPKSDSDEQVHDYGKPVNYVIHIHIPMIAFTSASNTGINLTRTEFGISKVSNNE